MATRAEIRAKNAGKVVSKTVREDPTAGMNHMQIFAHLIKAGPFMHGTPGQRKGGKS